MDAIIYSAVFGAIAIAVAIVARFVNRRILIASCVLFGLYLGLDDFAKCEIFMCLDGQGHRADDTNDHRETQGVWMTIWVDDVDAIHTVCKANDIEVTWGPVDEPWCVREMHVRHPDGHIFRMSKGLGQE